MKPITLQELYDLFVQHPKVSTDTRHIEPGSIFFALKGSNFDGNAFASEAIRLGAVAAIVDNPTLEGEHLYLVADVLKTLQELARHHREQLGIPLIAITGTNGKTTTKELTAAVLETTYNILYTRGNLNNHIGVPLTLLSLRDHHQIAIIEMGASKPGDIEELCQIALPNYGIITNIGMAHLHGFGSVEQVTQTKAELYRSIESSGGLIFRRKEDETLSLLAGSIPSILYGSGGDALVSGHLLEGEPSDLRLRFVWSAPSLGIYNQEQTTELVGSYNLDNALVAIAVGLFFDVSATGIHEALKQYRPNNNRSQLVHSERNTIVADAYNANPTSMEAAVVNLFSSNESTPRLLILGDMNELGASSPKAHHDLRRLVERLLRPGVDEVYYCGPLWKHELEDSPANKVFENVGDLISYLKSQKISDKLILVKGSNGIGLNQIIPYL